MPNRIRESFIQELEGGSRQLNLARASLLLAKCLGQQIDVFTCLAQLDDLAKPLRPQLEAATDWLEKLALLHRYLFAENSFSGNVHDYYAPENSFLNHVLNTQSGIPISLSVVYLEVGWRLDLPVWGIGMPRHFIVGYGQTDDPVYVDVFNRGMILSVDDCLEIADVPQTRRDVFQQQYLRPVSKKAILYRMLLNLKQIYFNAKAWESAYNVVDFLTLVNPKQASEFKDLGLLALRQNRLQDALFSLNRYLYMAPRQEDTDWIKDRVKLIEERLSQLN